MRMLLWTFVCKYLREYVFSIFFFKYPRVELLGHIVNTMNKFWNNCQNGLPQHLLDSHQHCVRMLISKYTSQYFNFIIAHILVGSLFFLLPRFNSSLYIEKTRALHECKCFLPFCRYLFHFLYRVLWHTKVFFFIWKNSNLSMFLWLLIF